MSEIERLIRAMHDSLCGCGCWCAGAQKDYETFTDWVRDYWGSTHPLEYHLTEVRLDASTDNE